MYIQAEVSFYLSSYLFQINIEGMAKGALDVLHVRITGDVAAQTDQGRISIPSMDKSLISRYHSFFELMFIERNGFYKYLLATLMKISIPKNPSVGCTVSYFVNII